MKQFLIGLGNKIKAIINGAMDALVATVSDLKKFLLAAILIMMTLDVFLKGKAGFIEFLTETLGKLIGVLSSVSWPIVVVVLLILLFFERRDYISPFFL